MANEKIINDFVKTYLDICLNPNKQSIGESRTVVIYDEFGPFKEQENKMEELGTKVFEYCIINFNEDGVPYIEVGPAVIVTCGEENPRDVALLRIGCKYADEINDDSEVQIRPFC